MRRQEEEKRDMEEIADKSGEGRRRKWGRRRKKRKDQIWLNKCSD